MSYILDALKKADAQRERDPARGIHAQPAAAAPARPSQGYRPWFWAAAAVAGAALLSAGWYLSQDQASVAVTAPLRDPAPAAAIVAAPPAAAVSGAAVPVTVPPQVATAVLPPPAAPRHEPAADSRTTSQPAMRGRPQPGSAPAQGAAATTGTARATPAAASSAPVAVSQPAPEESEEEAPRSARRSRSRAAAPASAPAVASTSPAPVAAAPAPTSGGLPPDAPKFAISGGVYSSNPAQRMLIVNGQVVNEGADLGSGVVLDEIRPKAAVLRFRGTRYNVGF